MLEMPTASAIERYLSLNMQRMKLTAANIANVDTPGYKALGIDFQGEFARALDSQSTMSGAETTVTEVPGLTSRPDGNNVSADRESMAMATTQLQFRTGIELLKHQYSQMMDAIKSDMK